MAEKVRYVFDPVTFADLVKNTPSNVQLSADTIELADKILRLLALLEEGVVTKELLAVTDQEWAEFWSVIQTKEDLPPNQFWKEICRTEIETTQQNELLRRFLKAPSAITSDWFV